MTALPSLEPIQALVIAQAYVIMADGSALPEERATIVSLLRKHVTRQEFTDIQLQNLSNFAFDFVGKHPYEEFLHIVEGSLSPAQRVSLLCNMYEMMVIDGRVAAKEKEMVEQFAIYFKVDPKVVAAVRELMMVKNDTSLFLRADHPFNKSDFRFGFTQG